MAHEPEERVAGVHVGRHSTAAVQAGMLADMAGVHRAQERAATHMAAPKARDGTSSASASGDCLRTFSHFFLGSSCIPGSHTRPMMVR